MLTLAYSIKGFIEVFILRHGQSKDWDRVRHFYGWTSAAMRPHWSRALGSWNPHDWVNVGSEWHRLDAQRAFKWGVDRFTLIVALAIWGWIQ